MKVIAINGSPRMKGNTRESLTLVGEVLKENDIEFEIVDLKKLNLLPCNGCYSCMGKGECIQKDDINDLLIDFRIDYLEIPGTSYNNAPVRYSFRLSEEENLFMFYFAIIERLSKKIDIPFKMTASGFATDIQPQFIAIREALVNLLMHSDYFSTQKPRVRVFSDRIEFMNPGGLPKDIKSIIREDFSKPRNPIIARIFRTIRLAESAGSGFTKMFNGWFSGYSIKPYCFTELDYYIITFPFSPEDVPEDVPENVPVNRVDKILKIVENNKNITIALLADKLSVNGKTIKRDIEKLDSDICIIYDL